MLSISASSRQPQRDAWTRECLLHERAVALGNALDTNTHLTYTSHLQSYLTFCKMHDFPIEPTADTLSFYVVYMSHHIKPSSVDSYLSGICSQLEHMFPNVRDIRRHALVSRTLAGCKRMRGTPPTRRAPLGIDHVNRCLDIFAPEASHDNLLFCTLLVCGFFALHRLGELVWPDSVKKRSWLKVISRSSVQLWPSLQRFGYLLPSSKTDHIHEGAQILIDNDLSHGIDSFALFQTYLTSRDRQFPLNPSLWLTGAGQIPTRHWFLSRMQSVVDSREYAGHSLRAGGATFLAGVGWPDERIQSIGRWSSASFKIYIRKHPVVLQALLHARRV